MNIRLAQKNKFADAAAFERTYGEAIDAKIRERYSLSQELAILRQRYDNPAEFAAYNEYAEQCKAAVKAELED